jgi:hypothetical protein
MIKTKGKAVVAVANTTELPDHRNNNGISNEKRRNRDDLIPLRCLLPRTC